MRAKYYKKHYNFIEPIEIPFLTAHDEETDSYHYVLILKTLENMLSNEEIRNYCSTSDQCDSKNGFFAIKDGKIVKECAVFINGLRIIIFQDAFEICNPLESSKDKFNIIGIYMLLGNLPSFMRSKIDNIKLVALCKEKYINKFGWTVFLDRLIEGIQILEREEVNITLPNREIKNCLGSLLDMLD